MGLGHKVSQFLELPREERRFFVASWLLAAPMTLAVGVAGLQRTSRAVERVSQTLRGEPSTSIGAERGALLVRRAFRWSPARWATKDGGCLPRSLVQYALHTAGGEDVKLFVGVPPEKGRPFEAHAWVEDAARPNDGPREHAVLFELGAR